MITVKDLESRPLKAGRKSESAKKGIEFLFNDTNSSIHNEKIKQLTPQEIIHIDHDKIEMENLLKQLNEEKERLRKKEEELNSKEIKLNNLTQKNKKLITTYFTDKEIVLHFNKSTMHSSDLLSILSFFSDKYTKSHFSTYKTILEISQFGKISNCLITRPDFYKNKVQRSELNKCIDDLEKDGFIKCETGIPEREPLGPEKKFFTVLSNPSISK